MKATANSFVSGHWMLSCVHIFRSCVPLASTGEKSIVTKDTQRKVGGGGFFLGGGGGTVPNKTM